MPKLRSLILLFKKKSRKRMSTFKKIILVGFIFGEYSIGIVSCVGYFILKDPNFTGTVILVNCFLICLEGLIKFCIYDRVSLMQIFSYSILGIFNWLYFESLFNIQAHSLYPIVRALLPWQFFRWRKTQLCHAFLFVFGHHWSPHSSFLFHKPCNKVNQLQILEGRKLLQKTW